MQLGAKSDSRVGPKDHRNLIMSAQAKMPSDQSPEQGPYLWIATLFLAFGALILLASIPDLFHNTAESLATEDKVFQTSSKVAVISASLVGAFTLYITRKLKLIERIGLPLILIVEVAVSSHMVSGQISYPIERFVDFPAGKTYISLVPFRISYAYRHHSHKGDNQRSGYYLRILPASTWPELKIAEEDYALMLKNTPDKDIGYEEILHPANFCVRVTMQQSEKSIRMLHSKSDQLPAGAVTPCPASTP